MKYCTFNSKEWLSKKLLVLLPVVLLTTSIHASHSEFINEEVNVRDAPYSEDGFNRFVAENCLSDASNTYRIINNVFRVITDKVTVGKSSFSSNRSDELIASDKFALCLASMSYGKILYDTKEYLPFDIVNDLSSIEEEISSYINLSAIEEFSEKFEEVRKEEPNNPNNIQIYLKYDSSKSFLGILSGLGVKYFSIADIVQSSPMARNNLLKKHIELYDDLDLDDAEQDESILR